LIDKRLLGTWQCDVRRTMKEVRNRREFKEIDYKGMRFLFSKWSMKYTRKKIYCYHNGKLISSSNYTVLGKDSESVAVLEKDYKGLEDVQEFVEEGSISQINFFDNNHYWINFGIVKSWYKRDE